MIDSMLHARPRAPHSLLRLAPSFVIAVLVLGLIPAAALADGPDHYVITCASPVTAGQVDSCTIAAYTSADALDTAYVGTALLSSSDTHAGFPVSVDFVAGESSFDVTFQTSGTQTMTAVDDEDVTFVGTSGDVTVTAAGADHFVVSSYPGSVVAGVSHTVTVTAKDAFGNTDTTYAGIVEITSSDIHAGLPANDTLSSGTGTFAVTLETVGTWSITATDTIATSITGDQTGIAVTAAGADHFVVSGPGTDVQVGTPFSVTVTAVDAFGNTASGYLGTVGFTSTDAGATLPSPYAFLVGDHGVRIFDGVTFAHVGSHTVTATDTLATSITGTSASITATGNAVSTTTVSSDLNPSVHNDSVTFTVHVTGSFGTPTGDVEIFDGVTSLGTRTLDGSGDATLSTSTLATGHHSITAVYAGDATYATSSSTTPVDQVVDKGTPVITFSGPAPTAVVGGATYTPAATSPSPAPIGFTIDATASTVCTISGGVVSFIAVGTCKINANQVADTDWNAAVQVQRSFAVNKGTPVITFSGSDPTAVVGGATYTPAATSPSPVAIVFSLDASSTGCTLSGGIVSFIAVGTCKVNANQIADTNWNAAVQVQRSFAVNKGTPVITFSGSAPTAVVGGATYTPAATSPSPVTIVFSLDASSTGCTLSGGIVSFTAVGTCKVNANQAADTDWNAAAQVQRSFAVDKDTPVITFTGSVPTAVVGGATYTPAATSPSPVTIVFSLDASSTGCTLSGGVVSFIAVGTCKIDANQAADTDWNAAAQAQRSFAVDKGTPVITFTGSVPTAVVGGATYTPAATSPSPVTIVFSLDASSTGCTISGGVVSFIAVGTCKVDANQIAGTNWNAAAQVQRAITVNKGTPVITFTGSVPTAVVGGATYTPAATSTNSVTPIVFTIDATTSTICTFASGVVSFTAVGTCKVDANQALNTNWNAAAQVQRAITVNKGTPVITFSGSVPTAVVGGATYTPAATSTNSVTPIVFTLDSSSTGCTISGGIVTFTAVGTCKVDANQIAGTNWNAAAQVQRAITVGKGTPVITFTGSVPTAVVGGATYTPAATSPSPAVIVFTLDSSSTGCSLSGGVVSFIAVGTCKVDANQIAGTNWNAAAQVQRAITVGKGTPVITFTGSAPTTAVVGGATYTPAATSPSPAAIAFTIDATASTVCTISSGVVSFIGIGTCKVDANQIAGTNWNAAAQVQRTFTVGQGTPVITFTSTKPTAARVAGATYTVATSSPSPVARVLTIDATASSVCTISGSVVSFIAVGTCKIDANQAANTNWKAAAQVQQSFAVGANVPAKPTTVKGTAGKGSVTVSWTAGANNGSAITMFTATSAPLGKTCQTTVLTSPSCKITGLTLGSTYTFTVTATNAVGTSAASVASAGVVPLALTVPGQPTGVTGVGLDSSAVVSWLAPADDGGSAITAYKVTSTSGGKTCSTTGALTCKVTGLANHTSYKFTVTATNAKGTGAASVASSGVLPRVGASFVALTPNRILDTSTDLQIAAALTPYKAVTFQVTGRFPTDATRNVPTNATAITGILSVAHPTALGYLALTSTAADHPSTSTLNFPVGDARATGVTVALGSGGKLSVTYAATTGTADVSLDITGYFVLGTSGATYSALTPNRILDSRTTTGGMSGGLTAGTHRTFTVTGRVSGDSSKNVPTSAIAVTGTLTVIGQTKAGYITLGPDTANTATTASLYFPAGDTRATGITVKLGSGGSLSALYTAVAGAKANVLFDVTGFFIPGSAGAMYVSLTPNRILDSRSKLGLPGSLRANIGVSFTVTGRVPSDATKNVPTSAVAVTGVLTVTGQTAAGYLVLLKTKSNSPTTTSLSFPVSDTRATGVTVALGTGGILAVTYTATPSTAISNVIFDVCGYFIF